MSMLNTCFSSLTQLMRQAEFMPPTPACPSSVAGTPAVDVCFGTTYEISMYCVELDSIQNAA